MELGLGTSKKGSQGAARKQGKWRHDQTRNRLETQAGHKQLDARMVTSVLLIRKRGKATLCIFLRVLPGLGRWSWG
jgi:hypothetical protein